MCKPTSLIVALESVEDEDEVLTALSEELGNFVEYVGGPEWGHVLLSPLENLAAIEEPLVREKASVQDILYIRHANSHLGSRISEQNLRGVNLTAGRRILHSPHNPPLKS
jgi:hypothetical protein